MLRFQESIRSLVTARRHRSPLSTHVRSTEWVFRSSSYKRQRASGNTEPEQPGGSLSRTSLVFLAGRHGGWVLVSLLPVDILFDVPPSGSATIAGYGMCTMSVMQQATTQKLVVGQDVMDPKTPPSVDFGLESDRTNESPRIRHDFHSVCETGSWSSAAPGDRAFFDL